MSAPSYSDSPQNSTNYLGQSYRFTPTYIRKRDPITPLISPDIRPKENQGKYPINSLWTNITNNNVWLLTGIINNLARWILISSGSSGPMLMVGVPLGTSPITPDVNGLINFTSTGNTIQITGSAGGVGAQNINFDLTGGSSAIEKVNVQTGTSPIVPSAGAITINGATVLAGTHPVRTDGTGANTMAVEVQISQALAATDATKIGLSNYSSAQFGVDANGFVTLAGGTTAPVLGLVPDAHTAPGTTPVIPNGSGNIILEGGATFATGTQANPIRTNSLAANTVDLQIQLAGSNAASSTPNNFGVSQFDSTQFTVTSGFVQLSAGPIIQPGVQNLGIGYSAGTFSIQGANGSALSSSNPGYVTICNGTAGQLTTIKITANQTFVDSTGASTISGNLFGFTAAVAASQDVPFFIYAVINNSANAISFMISRYPNAKVSPAAGIIGKTGSAIADTQGSFFAMDNPTVANFATKPCISIGSFRMQKTAGDDWTVSALAVTDGIGQFNENTAFRMPTGQFGAAAGKYFADNGGTAPAFVNSNFQWSVDKNNKIDFMADLSDTTGGAGAGAVGLLFELPYKLNAGLGFVWQADGGGGLYTGNVVPSAGPTQQAFFYWTIGGAATAQVTNAQITAVAGRHIEFRVTGYIDPG